MKRAAQMLLLLLCVLLFVPPGSYVHSAAAASPRVLLLYDSLGKGTSKEGNVTVLQQLLAAYGVKVTWESLDQYESGTMEAYTYVITVINSPDLIVTHKAYLEDYKDYRGQYLHIGSNLPAKARLELQAITKMMSSGNMGIRIGGFSANQLGVQDMPYIASRGAEARAYGRIIFEGSTLVVPYALVKGHSAFAPYLQKGDISELAIAYVLKDWLSISKTPQTYLVFKEVYPFSDLELLEEMADRLYGSGIPFLISVRPIFSNTDYPAMKRYLEALKVVQSRNGSILINAPVVMPSINGVDHTLEEKMRSFISLLVNNRIAPLGIGAEMYWSYDKEYSEAGMGFFDSAVLFPNEKVMYMDPSNTSVTFTSSLYSLPASLLQELHSTEKTMPAFPVDTAITLDFPQGKEELEGMLQLLEGYWINFADYKQGNHEVTVSTDKISSSHGVISINGMQLNTQHTPEKVDSDYKYTKEQQQSFKRLFSVQNQFFIVVLIISLLLFGGLFVVGYRLYRQKYLK